MTVTKISSLTTLASLLALGASMAFAADAAPAKLQARAKVSEADARVTTLAKVPGGSVSSSELEKEHGKLVWSFDIAQTGSKSITEVQVDANTGKVVSTKTETAAQEHKEAIAEKPKC
jgi:uncharacterized membrane protein YkoI